MLENLFLQTVRLENLLVLGRLIHAEIIQKLAALCDFSKETAACGVILFVLLKVTGQKTDFLGEDSDLDLRRACILFVDLAVRDQLLLGFALDSHGFDREWDNKNKGIHRASGIPLSGSFLKHG